MVCPVMDTRPEHYADAVSLELQISKAEISTDTAATIFQKPIPGEKECPKRSNTHALNVRQRDVSIQPRESRSIATSIVRGSGNMATRMLI